MRILVTLIFGFASVAGAAGLVRAQDTLPETEASQPGQPPPPLQPPTAAPTELPPAPPLQPPPVPIADDAAVPPWDDAEAESATDATAEAASGQWVYTSEYGWIFLPYGNQYVYEGTTDDAYPYSFVYYPGYGWVWVVSPWVWGWGPYPYFAYTPLEFSWYNGLWSSGWGWGRYRGGHPRGPLPGPRDGVVDGRGGGGFHRRPPVTPINNSQRPGVPGGDRIRPAPSVGGFRGTATMPSDGPYRRGAPASQGRGGTMTPPAGGGYPRASTSASSEVSRGSVTSPSAGSSYQRWSGSASAGGFQSASPSSGGFHSGGAATRVGSGSAHSGRR